MQGFLIIPICWYLKSKQCRLTQCELVKYSLRWAQLCWVYIGHVDLILFVSFSFALVINANTVSDGIRNDIRYHYGKPNLVLPVVGGHSGSGFVTWIPKF